MGRTPQKTVEAIMAELQIDGDGNPTRPIRPIGRSESVGTHLDDFHLGDASVALGDGCWLVRHAIE